MDFLPANVDELTIDVSRGHDTDLDLDFVDEAPGDVSLWIGGSLEDLDDLTGATEVVGSVVSFVASFAIPAQSTTREALRLERDGEIVTGGYLNTTKRGRKRASQAYTVNIGNVTATVTIRGGSPSVADAVANLPVPTSDWFLGFDTSSTPGELHGYGRPLRFVPASTYTANADTSMCSSAPTVPANTLASGDLMSGRLCAIVSNSSGSSRTWTFVCKKGSDTLFSVAIAVPNGTSSAALVIDYGILFSTFEGGWASATLDGQATEAVIVIAAHDETASGVLDFRTTISGSSVSTTPALMFARFERTWTGP